MNRILFFHNETGTNIDFFAFLSIWHFQEHMSHVHRTQVRRRGRYSWNYYEWIAENIYIGTNIFSKCIYLTDNIIKCIFTKQTIILFCNLSLEIQLTINQYLINSLWPRYFIWWQRSWSTLVQVMVCYLPAAKHQGTITWTNVDLYINEVLWNSSEGNFTRDTSTIND